MKDENVFSESKIAEIKQLIEKGKKDGVLTYQEIMSTLQDVDLTPEQIDEIYEQFNVLGIDVTPDKVDIENLENDENEKLPDIVGVDDNNEDEHLDLSVPDG